MGALPSSDSMMPCVPVPSMNSPSPLMTAGLPVSRP